ncbi:MAG TPA: FAD:protein FMN transferase [Acidimicrobiales bacterium]|nr:FAD:protein FMN transferase [Acidimicrobiales bacterium]
MHRHLESVMGTVVGITSPAPLPDDGLAAAVDALHDADRVFSTWVDDSPVQRLRRGEAVTDAVDAALIDEVLERCKVARVLTGGAFDPWAMPGGVDPTGLVKGWAAGRALHALTAAGAGHALVHAGGGGWRVGIRHPARPDAVVAVVEVTAAIATSGDYERPGQLIDPATGRAARVAASATVTGPDLDLADALATGLAVGGRPVLARIDALDDYEAHLISDDGHHFATPGMAFVDP